MSDNASLEIWKLLGRLCNKTGVHMSALSSLNISDDARWAFSEGYGNEAPRPKSAILTDEDVGRGCFASGAWFDPSWSSGVRIGWAKASIEVQRAAERARLRQEAAGASVGSEQCPRCGLKL